MKKALITVAGNMTNETYLRICEGVEQKFNEKFEFERITDDSIIGGFIVKISGKVYDRSIIAQLKKMHEYLSE